MAKTSSGSGRQGFDPYKPSAGTDTWTQEMLDAYLASGAGGAEVFSPPEPPSTVEEERDINVGDTTLLPTGGPDVQGRILPLTPEEEAIEYSDTSRTRLGGKKLRGRANTDILETPDGVSLSYDAIIEHMNRLQTPGNLGPVNQPGQYAAGRTAEDWIDIGQARANAQRGANIKIPNDRVSDTIAGVNINYQQDFDPNREQNKIVDMLHTPSFDLENWSAQNIGDYNARLTYNPALMGRTLETIQDYSQAFKKYFDKKFAGDMQLKTQADLVEIQKMVLSKGYTPMTFSEFLYQRVAPASQLMEGNSPAGLSGAMVMAVLHHMYETQVAANREMGKITNLPRNQKDYNELSQKEKHGLRGIYEELWQRASDSEKGIGHKIANAANMQLTGPEKALVGSVALKGMREAFGEHFFLEHDSIGGLNEEPRVTLNEGTMSFIHNNQNLFNVMLNEDLKANRLDEEGRKSLEDAGVDFKSKGWSGIIRKYLAGQDLNKQEDKEFQKAVLHYLDDTPHTTLGAQSIFFSTVLGRNAQTGQYTPNAVSHLLDGEEYKNIVMGGTINNRTKSKNRPNPVTGEIENVFYGSDQEKDTRVQLHMDAALEYFYNKNQIRFDHFVGANFRYYHKSSRFDPTNHSARAFLGSGAYVNFKTDNASHMMKIKAGIMTMTKLNMPGTKVRLSDVRFQARADAYDQIIETWQEKYGDLVTVLTAIEGGGPVAQQMQQNLMAQLDNPSSQMALAYESLLNYGADLDGYYTVNAVIEGVKLKQAIDRKDPAFRSNYMFEVDGTSNGISINALFTANADLLAATGITKFLMSPDRAYKHEDNIMSTEKPYERLNSYIVSDFENRHMHAFSELLSIGTENGFITTGTGKGHLTVSIYGTGKYGNMAEAKNNFEDALSKNPDIMKQLKDAGWRNKKEITDALGEVNWNALVAIIEPLQKYNTVQTDFMNELIRQYEADPSLPEPVTILDSGWIMRHGYPVSTIHGPNMPSPFGGQVRQQTNIIDVQGRQRNKSTGLLKPYRAAITGAPVKMTHGTDAFMVANSVMRAAAENPGLADGIEGNVMLQMYDGFFASPMYADWMDKTLNEEFLNLGYKVNNLSALVKSAEAQGYDLSTRKMRALRNKIRNIEKNGRQLLKDFKVLHGNQYAIGDGAVATGRVLDNKGEKVTKLIFDDIDRLVPKSSEPTNFGLPPTGRKWKGKVGDSKKQNESPFNLLS